MLVDKPFIQWIDDLESADEPTRQQARDYLLNQVVDVVELLIETVQSQSGRKCIEAITILAQIHDRRCIDVFSKALVSSNILVGEVAVKALQRYGQEVIELFIHALPQSRHMVQLSIITALEKIGDNLAVLPLMSILRTTDSSVIRYTTIQALGVLGDLQAADLITLFIDDEDHHVQKRARIALERLGKHHNEHFS